jgi:hypothetical protein
MKFDANERIRKFVNMQYVKMKRLSAVGSLILLAINLSFTVYPYVEHRFPESIANIPRAWLGVPIILMIIMLLIWLGAHIYVQKMEMYRTEKRAEMVLNPYAVYAFNPFQEMWFGHIYLPTMKGVLELLPEGEEKEKIQKEYDMVRKWIEKGYIPKGDFPKHLKKFYITKKEQRL